MPPGLKPLLIRIRRACCLPSCHQILVSLSQTFNIKKINYFFLAFCCCCFSVGCFYFLSSLWNQSLCLVWGSSLMANQTKACTFASKCKPHPAWLWWLPWKYCDATSPFLFVAGFWSESSEREQKWHWIIGY